MSTQHRILWLPCFSKNVRTNEAPPQTDEEYFVGEGAQGIIRRVGSGRARNWKPVPSLDRKAVVGPERPVSTGAENEHTTDGGRSDAGARNAGGRGHRSNVLERVRSDAAAGRRSSQLFPVLPGLPVRLQCVDGSDHQGVHRTDGAVCQTRESGGGALPKRTAEG